MLRLTMRRGPTPGAVYDLSSDEITIGRGNKNHIVIRDNEVSRVHCRLVRLTGNYEVHDLESVNGTFVNGQRVVAGWLLQPGALIELGDSITLEYGLPEDDSANGSQTLPPVIETSTHYSLLVINGPGSGETIPLLGPAVTLGRDPTCDLVMSDPEVSRYHLRLYASANGYLIEDLGSTNGTFVNDVALGDTRLLAPDDMIRLGTMVQLQYLVREEQVELGDEDTPVSHSPDLEATANSGLEQWLHVDSKRRTITARSTGLEPGTLRDHLMIVYAREDWESMVAPLLVRFQDTRLNAWVDQYLTPESDDWRVAVEQALKECWLMLLVVSPQMLASPAIHAMYHYFLAQNKPVIPLLHDAQQAMPPELNRLRSIVYDPESNARSFHKLIFEIMQLHKQPE
jgi:pSer/pThr/pTyr-binding forkhead associated (FHA) protein